MTRFRQIILGAATLFSLILPLPLQAQPPESALAAYEQGDFLRAADEAGQVPTSDAAALAAQALIAQAELKTPPAEREDIIERALAQARTAVELDPRSIEARLQLVAALGIRARFMQGVDAHFAGLPEETQKNIDYILEREPDNALAHGLYGCWHLIMTRKGGSLSNTLYGANPEDGIRHFERGLELDPDNVLILYQYALQLAALRDSDYTQRVDRALEKLMTMKAENRTEELLLARAGDLAIALNSGSDKKLLPVLAAQLGKPPAEKTPGIAPRNAPGR